MFCLQSLPRPMSPELPYRFLALIVAYDISESPYSVHATAVTLRNRFLFETGIRTMALAVWSAHPSDNLAGLLDFLIF